MDLDFMVITVRQFKSVRLLYKSIQVGSQIPVKIGIKLVVNCFTIN